MEAGNHDGAVNEAEDTDDLLCTDMDEETVSDFNHGLSALPRDHCDLLLDAIDAHLSCLQTHSHVQVNGRKSTMEVCLDRSNSVSKDTGLGSTDLSIDKATSTPDEPNSDHLDLSTVRVSKGQIEAVGQQDKNHTKDSKSEQCLWRLQQLLGTSRVGVKEYVAEELDSVCTEDFSTRFKEEMLEIYDPSSDGAAADSAPDAASISSDTGLLTDPQIIQNFIQNQGRIQNVNENCVKSFNRHLAGVPMKSFDSVTIDSDLESISTERIRQHLQSTVKTRTAQETQSGAHGRRLKYTQLSENQILSSDDEGIVGEENGKYVKRYRHPRAPSSVQRRERKDQSRRKSSTTSTFSTTSNEEQNGTIRKEFSVMEVSLAGLKKQKAAVLNVVEKLRGDLEEAEREHQTLQLSVTQTRTHTQLLCNELHKLKNQRDSCVKEVRALQEGQAAVQAHKCTCNYNPSPHRHINSSCVSLLEREEMDRLLDNTKLELFSEQRRFRKKMDSMQERLEEVTQELELREEESRSLREKCAELEEKLNAAVKRREELQECMQRQRVEQEGKLRALEKIIAQKELLLLGMQDEKNSIQAELIKVREEHRAKLQAVLEQSQKEKEEEVELMKTKLTQAHEHELQRVHSQEQEVKTAALREQALVHKRNTESLHSSIQLKEQEVKRLQKSVKQQQEVLRRREEELRAESFEQVKKAVEQEQIKFEEHRAKSLKEQKRTLEEQIQVVEKRGREEVEKEKRNALALQNKIVQMQTRINELENEVSVQTAKTGAINKEHHAETQRLCRQLKQEADSESSRLKKCVKQSEKQLQDLKFKLAECERVHQEAAERQEQQNTVWAQDIGTECACLQELLTHNGLTVDTKHLSHSGTVSESVLVLKSLRKPVQHLINSLQNRISSLTNTTQQISTEKDLELRLQREQLTIEKERALNSLKEKLIQEHIEELSSMSKMRLCEDDDGVVASLRRQLQAKDEELRKVQRNMAQWKEKTTKRLARKFEEELNTELERKVSKARSEPQWRLEMLEGEMRHLTQNYREHIDAQLTPASSTNVPGLANTPSSHDLASYKLLLHLQGRIRQLQADKQTHTPSPACLNRAGDLAGSYLETIAPLQTRCVPERSSMRTAPS